MSASISWTASQTRSIHLLRALLRESTYLPDAVARQHFRRYILSRFRAYQPKQNATASLAVQAVDKFRHRSFKRRQLSIITERTSKVQKKAQKGLHYLQRANQGELPCLQKVLYFAYGRMGRRKYTLLNHVLTPDPVLDGGAFRAAPDFEGPTPLQALYYSNKQYLQYFDAPKPRDKGNYVINVSDRFSRLRAVLKSQHRKGISLHRELKGPAMRTPIRNIWMRPMPIKRARNNVRRWYAETMTRMLPPIPTDEWNDLHDMVHGGKSVSIVRRRAHATTPNPARPDVEDIISEGMRMDKLSKATRPAGMWRPHNITPRFMRRLYSRILQLCCKVEYDSERKHWVATWGEATQTIDPKIYQMSSDESLFAGVDARGNIPGKKVEPPVEHDRGLQPRNHKGEFVHFPFFTEFLPENNPLRRDLDEWKRKRLRAGIIDEDGTLRRR